MTCGTPEPGETMEAMLERRQADGSITVDDADTVREFADFLRDMGPVNDQSPESMARQRRALIEHADFCGLSAEDVVRLQAIDAPRGAVCPECAVGKCAICAREALDPATDLIVPCACTHKGLS